MIVKRCCAQKLAQFAYWSKPVGLSIRDFYQQDITFLIGGAIRMTHQHHFFISQRCKVIYLMVFATSQNPGEIELAGFKIEDSQ